MDRPVFDNSSTFKELQLDQNKWIQHNSKCRLRYLKEKNSGAKMGLQQISQG